MQLSRFMKNHSKFVKEAAGLLIESFPHCYSECAEEKVKNRGGITIYLGTDDEFNKTSLGDTDLGFGVPDPISERFISHSSHIRLSVQQTTRKQGVLPLPYRIHLS